MFFRMTADTGTTAPVGSSPECVSTWWMRNRVQAPVTIHEGVQVDKAERGGGGLDQLIGAAEVIVDEGLPTPHRARKLGLQHRKEGDATGGVLQPVLLCPIGSLLLYTSRTTAFCRLTSQSSVTCVVSPARRSS